MDKLIKTNLISKFQTHASDSGSPEVQIALLTERIRICADHLRINKKDNICKRSLLILINRRKKLLKYLSKVDHQRYLKVAQDLEIRIKSA